MKKLKVVMICFAVAFLLGFMAHSFNVLAEDKSPEQKAARKAIEKGLEESLGMPVLKGDLGQKMTHDAWYVSFWV